MQLMTTSIWFPCHEACQGPWHEQNTSPPPKQQLPWGSHNLIVAFKSPHMAFGHSETSSSKFKEFLTDYKGFFFFYKTSV